MWRRREQTRPHPDRYERFYRESYPCLVGHLRRLGLTEEQDLEEVVQDTYVEAYKSWPSLKDDKAATAWLLTIGRRQWGRRIENLQKQRRIQQECASDEYTTRQSAEASDLGQRLIVRIRNFLSSLPEPKAQAMQMFFLYQCSLKEVSAATGVGISTLTTWSSRTRAELRTRFGDDPAQGTRAIPKQRKAAT